MKDAHTTAQALAEACARAMWNEDSASQRLDMALEHIAPGEATLAMDITDQMTNGHGTCHGGLVFALADSAFAFACNSRGVRTVAAGCAVEFLAPAHEGDELVAEARERSLQGRTGVYDVDVRRGGELVATFRGRSAAMR